MEDLLLSEDERKLELDALRFDLVDEKVCS